MDKVSQWVLWQAPTHSLNFRAFYWIFTPTCQPQPIDVVIKINLARQSVWGQSWGGRTGGNKAISLPHAHAFICEAF